MDEAAGLAEEFADLVRGRRPEPLDGWLTRARDGGTPALRRFAKRLPADEGAVRAAATPAWSNGQT